MKKFFVLVILAAFIAVVSCNTNLPVVPQGYEQRLTEIFGYWPYTIGDSLAYVNENGDSIILVVITDSTSFSYHPNYNPENDSDDIGPCEMMDEFKIYFACSSPRNSFNRNDLKFSTSCQYTNYREARIYFDCYSPTPPMYKLNTGITWNYNINNNDSLLKFFSDSVRLRRSAPNSPETNYIEEYGDLIRGKGVVRWTDLDGHQWRLVDLMNRE